MKIEHGHWELGEGSWLAVDGDHRVLLTDRDWEPNLTDEANREANAKHEAENKKLAALFEAAPLLLDACKLLLDAVDDLDKRGAYTTEMDAARVLIACAEGKPK